MKTELRIVCIHDGEVARLVVTPETMVMMRGHARRIARDYAAAHGESTIVEIQEVETGDPRTCDAWTTEMAKEEKGIPGT